MREYLVVFLVAAATTYLFTVIARELALRTNAFAPVRDRDVHDEPVPYLGGVAMLGGLWSAYAVAGKLPFLSRADSFIFDQARAVLIAGTVICLVGVLDDIFDIDALTKFGGQVLAASLLVAFGVQYYYRPDFAGGISTIDPAQGALGTVLMVVITVNAVNFVDGLDGLAAGIVGVGAASMFLFCYYAAGLNELTLATGGAMLSAALAGVCTGFLPHNFHPARLFMGDSGSMLIGLVLAASIITFTGQFAGADIGGARIVLLPMLLPISLAIVPLADLVAAVFRRTRAGRSPFAADKQHLHHRMLEFGHTHRRAVVILWPWDALLGGSVVLLSLFAGMPTYVGMALALLLCVVATFVLPVISRPQVRRGAESPPEATS